MSASWLDGEALAFDTESTGLNVLQERVVSIALVTLGNGQPRCKPYLINPGIDIPDAAIAVHRITNERVRADGCAPADALESTATKIADALSHGIPVVAMNAVYDLSLLHMDCLRHGVQTVSSRLGGHHKVRPIIDVYVLDQRADKYRTGGRKLTDLCAFYGVKHHGAHDAGYDALAAAEIAGRIAARYPAIAARTPDEIHDDQVAWKAAQNADRQAYKRRTTGDRTFTVETGWPLYDAVIAADPTP